MDFLALDVNQFKPKKKVHFTHRFLSSTSLPADRHSPSLLVQIVYRVQQHQQQPPTSILLIAANNQSMLLIIRGLILTLLSRDSRSADMEEEEGKEVDVEMEGINCYYVVLEDQHGQHMDDEVVFMENEWNRRSGPMPSNLYNHELMYRGHSSIIHRLAIVHSLL